MTDSINNIPFISEEVFTVGSKSTIDLTLQPDNEKVNGIHLAFIDNSGQIIPNVNFCLFRNEALADSNNCEYSNYQGKSSEFGTYLKLNIPKDRYFVNITDTIAGRPIQKLKHEINIPQKGILKGPPIALELGLQGREHKMD